MSNHGHVLSYLSCHPEARARDVASDVGLTERAVQKLIGDLVEGGYVAKTRAGRRNHYRVVAGRTFRHPVEAGVNVDDFLDLVRRQGGSALTPPG